ncbi:kallikrein-7-like isoform X2 [Chrysoperla carnea]|uniref:kallikrein-7-like isoform X2 n=1 Tax=Chrysoperla carnea TaxID=189513 RepID=UPI001D07DDA1|nr:kallikrein-7-like isoform X2 [Chrysoperla carnea]
MIFKLFLVIFITRTLVYANYEEMPMAHPYPFMVSLQKLASNTVFKYCSGVIVSESWVLTNSQCVDKTRVDQNEIIVLAGILNSYNYDYKFAQIRKVVKIVRRRDENRNGNIILKDDLVLLKMNEPFMLRSNVMVARLGNHLEATGIGEIVGWGADAFPADETQSDHLLFAELDVVDQEKCYNYYKDVKEKFCVGNSQQVACSGDAGGPFVQYDQNTGEQIVVGLASVGAVPCTAKPALYTNVAYYKQFIKNTIKEN